MASFQMFSLTLCMLGNLSCICCCQRFSFFKINLFVCSIALLPVDIITCVTLAKAGLVIGQLPPSIHPSFSLSICITFGVPSLCNLLLQKFSFLYIQTLQNGILKMCTYYFVHISWIFSQVLGVLNLDIFPSKMLWWCLNRVICNLPTVFMSLFLNFA